MRGERIAAQLDVKASWASRHEGRNSRAGRYKDNGEKPRRGPMRVETPLTMFSWPGERP
jgi:hypothetical protein